MKRLRELRHLMLCLFWAFAQDPGLAWRNLHLIRLNAPKSWRQFSLKLFGTAFLRDYYAASHEAGMRPFLMWGTLLGCVRDGGFIAHDYDIDVGILSVDYERKDLLIAAMTRRGYRARIDVPYKLRFTRPDRLSLDVDVFYSWNGDAICTMARKDGSVSGARFPIEAFARLRPEQLNGIAVLIPDPPELVLSTIYGAWHTPRPGYKSGSDLGNAINVSASEPKPPFTLLSESPRPAISK